MRIFRAAQVVMVFAVLVLAACSNDDDPPAFTHPGGVLGSQLPMTGRPFGAAVGDAGLLLATRLDAASVGQGLTTGSAFPASIAVGSVPTDITLSPDRTIAYVTNQDDGTVGFVSLTTRTQTATTPLGAATFRVRAGAGNLIYVSTNVAKVYSVSAATGTVVDDVTVGADPNGMVFSPDGTRLYVTNQSSGDLSEVIVATMTVARTIPLGGKPQDIAISPDGTQLYVANEGGPMQVVTVATGAVASAGPETSYLFGLALSPDGVVLVGSRPSAGQVDFIDRASQVVTSTIETGGRPRRVAFSPYGDVAVVTNEAGWVDRIR